MKRVKILIVDDEENIRFALKRWFEFHGYDVDVADDGDVAVEKCRANAYDVVTLDIEMPRMDGRTALEGIRRYRPHLPVIVLTGYAEELDGAFSGGVSRVLIKPVSLSVLEHEVRSVINGG